MPQYPVMPGPRIAYDKDGTVIVKMTSGHATPNEMVAADVTKLNSESILLASGAWTEPYPVFAFVFPEPRRLNGLFMYTYAGKPSLYTNHGYYVPSVSTSQNTTNGIDGTWSAYEKPNCGYNESSYYGYGNSDPYDDWYNNLRPYYKYRRDVTPTVPGVALLSGPQFANVRGIRIRAVSSTNLTNPQVVHLYGQREETATTDGMQFWKSAADEPLGYWSWDEAAVGSSADLQVRLKNRSSVRTATGITVQPNILTDTTPSVKDTILLSWDGTTWETFLTIASLAAGAVSPIMYVRRVTPSTAVLGVWSPRLLATIGAWS